MTRTNQRATDHGQPPRIMLDTDVKAARAMAAAAHLGQVDKAGRDYIEHPERVVGHLANPTNEQRVVAWLHDVVEDTPTTLDSVEAAFGPIVVAAVDAMTHRDDEMNLACYARVSSNPIARAVKAADLADNTDPKRLQVLPQVVRDRLEAKYAIARRELGIDQHH